MLAAIILTLIAYWPRALADTTPSIHLPDMGDTSAGIMSPVEEQRLGEAFMRSVRRSVTIVDDPEVDEYIQSLGYRLVAGADPSTPRFHFFVVLDPNINAFAGPGGYIGVHSGLLLAAETESEVASVLAHEIAHITQRHLLRAFEKANRMNIPATAALIAAIILSGQNPQLAQAALATTLATAEQMQLNFTRAHELEADRMGLQILASAGYDPRSMPAFFEQLQLANRFYEGGVPEFLRTHPMTSSRIADTRARAEQFPITKKDNSFGFALVQAKLRVMAAEDSGQTVDYFKDKLPADTAASQDAARYGLALALLAHSEYDAARNVISALLTESPDNIPYLITQARIESAAGNAQTALRIYANALKLYPRSYPLTLLYATALVNDAQPQAARQLLQEYLRYRDPRPLLYKVLAQADNAAGFPIESQQALAEYAYLNGRTHTAIEHLNRALAMTRKDDFYRASRIEARLKDLQREAAQETKL